MGWSRRASEQAKEEKVNRSCHGRERTLNATLFRFLIQPKRAPPRRDVHLHHVIINDKANDKLSQHRVRHRLAARRRVFNAASLGCF